MLSLCRPAAELSLRPKKRKLMQAGTAHDWQNIEVHEGCLCDTLLCQAGMNVEGSHPDYPDRPTLSLNLAVFLRSAARDVRVASNLECSNISKLFKRQLPGSGLLLFVTASSHFAHAQSWMVDERWLRISGSQPHPSQLLQLGEARHV